MSRKIALTPLQGSIVQMLGGAGEENLMCIKATLKIQNELLLDAAIQGLQQLGYVTTGFEPSSNLPSLVLTREGRQALDR
jgi:hypothetical protein